MASVLPPNLPPDVDKGPGLLALWWSLAGVASVFVCLRLYARIFVRKRVGWDDYFIALALIAAVAGDAVSTAAVHYGFGRHIFYLTPPQVVGTIKWMKAIELVTILGPVCVKLSVCLTILRLVSRADRPVTITLWIMMAILVLSSIVAFVVMAVQCVPLYKLWDPAVPGTCLNIKVVKWVYQTYGIVGVITDFGCAIIPALILHKLQMDRRTKIALCCVLGLAIIPCVCGIFKTIDVSELDDLDISWALHGEAHWIAFEDNGGIIVACLPSLYSGVVTACQMISGRFSSWKHSISQGSRERLPIRVVMDERSHNSPSSSVPASAESSPEDHYSEIMLEKPLPPLPVKAVLASKFSVNRQASPQDTATSASEGSTTELETYTSRLNGEEDLEKGLNRRAGLVPPAGSSSRVRLGHVVPSIVRQ